jgi:uroporphyrinogen decarboxylase
MAKIVKGVKAKHPNIPITLFSKNGGKYLTYIADTLCDGIGLICLIVNVGLLVH